MNKSQIMGTRTLPGTKGEWGTGPLRIDDTLARTGNNPAWGLQG